MIVDAFTYNGEADLLELRLAELWPVVDRFVIVEADTTFTGLAKSRLLPQYMSRYDAWWDKICYVPVKLPEGSTWQRERYQREQALQGVTDLPDDTLMMISDCDEIPSAVTVANLEFYQQGGITGIDQRHFYYWLNCESNEREPFTHVAALSIHRQHGCHLVRRACKGDLPLNWTIRDGGWHWTYLGGVEAIQHKLVSFSHTEYSGPYYTDAERIWRCITTPCDLFDRNYYYNFCTIGTDYPKYLRDNLHRFEHLVYKPDEYVLERGTPWQPALTL